MSRALLVFFSPGQQRNSANGLLDKKATKPTAVVVPVALWISFPCPFCWYILDGRRTGGEWRGCWVDLGAYRGVRNGHDGTCQRAAGSRHDIRTELHDLPRTITPELIGLSADDAGLANGVAAWAPLVVFAAQVIGASAIWRCLLFAGLAALVIENGA